MNLNESIHEGKPKEKSVPLDASQPPIISVSGYPMQPAQRNESMQKRQPIHEGKPKEKSVPQVWSQPLFFSVSGYPMQPAQRSESMQKRQPIKTNDEN